MLTVKNVGSLGRKWSYYFNRGVDSSPAVANGVVYVGSDDNNVYALNASTGAKLWSYNTGGFIGDSSPALANGVVYVGSADDNVYALNASTGATLWSYTTGSAVASSPAVANGVLYVGSLEGGVYLRPEVKARSGKGRLPRAHPEDLYASSTSNCSSRWRHRQARKLLRLRGTTVAIRT